MPRPVHDHEFHEVRRTPWTAHQADGNESRFIKLTFQCGICGLTHEVQERAELVSERTQTSD